MFETSSIMLATAYIASTLGLAFLALAMEVHWAQVQGSIPLSGSARLLLRGLGVLDLAISLVLCLSADHATMAALVWIMLLAAGAVTVAFTLTWRPRWLAPLAAWLPQSGDRPSAK
jgi:uncharacterized membrane protein YkgB